MGACCSKGLNKYATALRHRWNNRPIGVLVRRPALLVYLQVSWAVKLASWDDRRRAANHAARRTQTDERMTSISDRQSDRNAISVIVAIPHPHLHIAIENLAHTRLHRVRLHSRHDFCVKVTSVYYHQGQIQTLFASGILNKCIVPVAAKRYTPPV